MKILIISHEFPPIGGGGANACYYLSKGFHDYGHEVTVITANYKNLPEEQDLEGVRIIRVNSIRKRKEQCSFKEMLSFILKAWPKVKIVCNKDKFDICQVFFGIPSGPLGYLLKKKNHIPYVIRFGGGDIPGFQARYAFVYKVLAPFIKIIWKNADELVANSEGLKKLADNFYAKKKIIVIPNGVDCEQFFPKKNESNKELKLLFVSRLIERKGLQYVLPQLKELKNKELEFSLIVVGEGPYETELKKIVKEKGLESQVHFVGYKNKKEIVGYYQQADIFILPSEKEGMPNVVLEAMASGLAILMTPCEGSKELIQNNGKIISADRFGEYIQMLYCDREKLNYMKEESRKRAKEFFSWSSVVGQYITVFERNIK